jgi:hypothetical protein
VSPPNIRDDESVLQGIIHLASTVKTIEGHLLRLIRDVAHGTLPLNDFLDELSPLSKELQRCLRQVTEMTERRDLTFRVFEDLQEITRQCIWLCRKMHLEKAFFTKLHLETRLQSLISADAFRVYEELLNAEDQEQTLRAKEDVEIRKLLLAETATSPEDGE